jgi:hypothetical protein
MAKRFVDTEIWNKSWYQELTLKEKLLVKYIFENCDCAGVWDINFRLASFIIGESITKEDVEEINKKNRLFDTFNDDKIFVIDFIKFQYGTLSENCKPHKPIIEKLKKYNLFERVSKGYSKGIETLEEKEKEKEKEIEQEKERKKDPFCSDIKETFIKEYKKVFNQNAYLGREQLLKLAELNSEYDNLEELLPIAIKRLKNVQQHKYFKDNEYKADAIWLLKNSNFEKVMNGVFGIKEEEKQQEQQEQEEKDRYYIEQIRKTNPALADRLERGEYEV